MYTKQLQELLRLKDDDVAILNSTKHTKLVSSIARDTSLPRSTVVYRIPILQKRGLLKEQIVGKRSYWKSIPENEIGLKTGKKSTVSMYRGVKEIISLWYKIASLPRFTRLIVLQPHQSLKLALKSTPPDDAINISKLLKDRKFIFDAVEQEESARVLVRAYKSPRNAKRIIHAFTERLEDIVKVPDDFIDEKAEIYIASGKIFLIDWDTQFALMIENQAMARLLSGMYEKVKAYGVRYEQGKYLEKISKKRAPNGAR